MGETLSSTDLEIDTAIAELLSLYPEIQPALHIFDGYEILQMMIIGLRQTEDLDTYAERKGQVGRKIRESPVENSYRQTFLLVQQFVDTLCDVHFGGDREKTKAFAIRYFKRQRSRV